MKSAVCRLAVPSFDLTTVLVPTGNINNSNNKKQNQQHKEYVLVPGGGGSTKSGVKNQIVSCPVVLLLPFPGATQLCHLPKGLL